MNQQLPAHLQKYQSRDLGSTLSQNLGAASPPYVSIAGGRFTLIDAAGNEQPVATFDPQLGVFLDACIADVGDHISRVYYDKEYDPSAQTFTPPDCWSDNGVGPSVSCGKPQSPTCASCQWAVWGSATSAQGKAIPACGMYQKTALVIPSHPQAVFLLRVPPNSHKNLRAYNELSKRSGIDISNVVTRIYFDRTTQGTLLFSAVSFIDDAVAQAREAAYVEKKTDTIVGRNDVARPTLAAPPPVQQISPPTTSKPPQSMFEQAVGQAYAQQAHVAPSVQQPAPFVQPYASATTAAQPAANAQMQQAPASATASPSAPAASPSNGATPPAPPQRRRRRTAAEMQQANAEATASQPAAAPQAPFPHPGQNPSPAQPDLQFGMTSGQPATANPEVQQAIDGFFGGA